MKIKDAKRAGNKLKNPKDGKKEKEMEEFQEAEVMWSDSSRDDLCRPISSFWPTYSPHQKNPRKESDPVRIPQSQRSCNTFREADGHSTREEEEGEMVPPHLVVARRLAGQMAFSVCTGNGRTLKGRDLSQVRNSVLRLTGFLEG